MATLRNRNMYLKKNENITINVQQIVYFTTFQMTNYNSLPEKHDFWELEYIESGEAVITSGDKDITLLQGEMFFHKPGTVHSTSACKGATIKPICISIYTTSKIMKVFEDLKLSLNEGQKKLIYKMYDEARKLFVNGNSNKENNAFFSEDYKDDYPLGTYQLLKIYIEMFLINVAQSIMDKDEIITYDSKESLEQMIYQKIIEMISESLYTRISIDNLCKVFNYSRSYIYDIFRKFSGTSIMNYYNTLKIKEAKKLIKDGKHSMSEISEMLGFTNGYYFSKVFKKFEGMTPSEYKKRAD